MEKEPAAPGRAPQDQGRDTLPNRRLRTDQTAIATDANYLADHVDPLQRGVAGGRTVAPRENVAARNFDHSMRSESSVAGKEDDLSPPQFTGILPLDSNQISGPDRRQHAQTCNPEICRARAANYLHDHVAARPVIVS